MEMCKVRRRGLRMHRCTVVIRVIGLVMGRRVDIPGIVTDGCKAFDRREQVRTSGPWLMMMMAFVAAFLPGVDAVSG
jgi:hypothetical protein